MSNASNVGPTTHSIPFMISPNNPNFSFTVLPPPMMDNQQNNNNNNNSSNNTRDDDESNNFNKEKKMKKRKKRYTYVADLLNRFFDHHLQSYYEKLSSPWYEFALIVENKSGGTLKADDLVKKYPSDFYDSPIPSFWNETTTTMQKPIYQNIINLVDSDNDDDDDNNNNNKNTSPKTTSTAAADTTTTTPVKLEGSSGKEKDKDKTRNYENVEETKMIDTLLTQLWDKLDQLYTNMTPKTQDIKQLDTFKTDITNQFLALKNKLIGTKHFSIFNQLMQQSLKQLEQSQHQSTSPELKELIQSVLYGPTTNTIASRGQHMSSSPHMTRIFFEHPELLNKGFLLLKPSFRTLIMCCTEDINVLCRPVKDFESWELCMDKTTRSRFAAFLVLNSTSVNIKHPTRPSFNSFHSTSEKNIIITPTTSRYTMEAYNVEIAALYQWFSNVERRRNLHTESGTELIYVIPNTEPIIQPSSYHLRSSSSAYKSSLSYIDPIVYSPYTSRFYDRNRLNSLSTFVNESKKGSPFSLL